MTEACAELEGEGEAVAHELASLPVVLLMVSQSQLLSLRNCTGSHTL
jgi:hypothetical protein